MIVRAIALAGGIAGAAGLSQYPEFSQQYVQRLGGQVEALASVVADFDASAARAELTRDEALEELSGSVFLDGRQVDMRRTFARFERLSSDRAMLSNATPVERIFMPQRLRDPELLAGTWSDFKPALPLTVAGLVAAGLGFLLGWIALGGVLRLLAWPFRARHDDRPVRPGRVEPTLR